VLVRASASKGFRAPSLSENASNSTNISYGTRDRPVDPDVPGSRQNPTFFTVGNSDLKPERTQELQLSAWCCRRGRTSLISWTTTSIKLDNLVGTNNTQTLVTNDVPPTSPATSAASCWRCTTAIRT
jgi:iron complex outermembrane receptor protein